MDKIVVIGGIHARKFTTYLKNAGAIVEANTPTFKKVVTTEGTVLCSAIKYRNGWCARVRESELPAFRRFFNLPPIGSLMRLA